MTLRAVHTLLGLLILVSAGPATQSGGQNTPTLGQIALTPASTQPSDLPGLHNFVAYSAGLYSGAVPEGEVAFQTLRDLGIRTILSVDGATPDVELARKYGLRYVHLPIGYDGMDETRRLEVARAVRDLPGPMYIHCHHGKHRSAAAAAAAAVMLGKLTPDQAVARMKVSGTAPAYPGLFRCATDSKPVTADELAKASAEFPEVSRINNLASAMVEVDEVFDRLKLVEKSGWVVPKDHPDLVPASLAGQLADLYRNAQVPDGHRGAEDLVKRLAEAAAEASALEEAIIRADRNQSSTHFKAVAASCNACHVMYRN